MDPSWATFATGALLIGALGFDRVTGKLLGFVRRRDTPADRPTAPTGSA
jgi:hypothetical protein